MNSLAVHDTPSIAGFPQEAMTRHPRLIKGYPLRLSSQELPRCVQGNTLQVGGNQEARRRLLAGGIGIDHRHKP